MGKIVANTAFGEVAQDRTNPNMGDEQVRFLVRLREVVYGYGSDITVLGIDRPGSSLAG